MGKYYDDDDLAQEAALLALETDPVKRAELARHRAQRRKKEQQIKDDKRTRTKFRGRRTR